MDIFKFVALLADLLAFSWFGLGKESYLGSTINFFIYDTIKIVILLIIINYFMAITRYHFPMEKVRDLLTKRRLFRLDYLFATALGIITLFCSCSSIPSFIGFIEVGILLGVTFAFLISSPLVNKFSLYLFPTMFEMKVTMLYNVVGINISILGGMLVHKLKIEKYVKPNLLKLKARNEVEEERGEVKLSFKELVKYFWKDSWIIIKEVFPYVLLGVGIGSLIHGFVSADLVEKYLSNKSFWILPLTTLLGSSFYANLVNVILVMEALALKNIPMGTVLAFMTTVVTVSIPQAMILKKSNVLATF